MAGAPPKPAHLKLIEGNPGGRPVHEDKVPEPSPDVTRPAFVKGRAAKVWQRYEADLIRMGLLTASDVHLFAAWCALAVKVETDAASMSAADMQQLRVIGAQFGMGASERARIGLNLGRNSGKHGGKKEAAGGSKWFGR